MKREGNLKLLISISHGFWIFLFVFSVCVRCECLLSELLSFHSWNFSVVVKDFKYLHTQIHRYKTKRKWHGNELCQAILKSDFPATNLLSAWLCLSHSLSLSVTFNHAFVAVWFQQKLTRKLRENPFELKFMRFSYNSF